MSDPVLAAGDWPTNADLMVDVARLGYLDGHVLDPTYGRGVWWQKFQPTKLTACDLDPAKSPIGHSVNVLNIRDHFGREFDNAVYDPPYIAPGGRKTSTIDNFNDGYGLTIVPKTPRENQDLINKGIYELAQVVKPKGYISVKCMDYITSGKLWAGTHYTIEYALADGLQYVDRFDHVGRPGPQPKGRRQVHARRNLSTLLIFRT